MPVSRSTVRTGKEVPVPLVQPTGKIRYFCDYLTSPVGPWRLAFVFEEIVRHIHRLLVGNPEGVVQDSLSEVARDVVVPDALCDRVIPMTRYRQKVTRYTQNTTSVGDVITSTLLASAVWSKESLTLSYCCKIVLYS